MDRFLIGYSSFRNIIMNRTMPRGFQTYIQKRRYADKNDSTKRVMVLESEIESDNSLDPPTNCCMSGCPNCVWLEYADKLKAHFVDAGSKVEEAIEREVDDPSLKAYLLFELRMKNKL